MTETQINRSGPRGGVCAYCSRVVGGLVVHERYCLKRDWDAETVSRAHFIARASAHATATPRAAQRWQNGVTDLDVASVLFAIEANGFQPHRNAAGRWLGMRMDRNLSTVVNEMIRTGLLRHVMILVPGTPAQDAVVPALVHLKGADGWSVCHFTGEDMGPMRSRLLMDLALVDCLHCCDHPRGL